MIDFLHQVLLFPYSIGKYVFSLAAYWFVLSYSFQSDTFIAFTEYCERKWVDWVKRK